MTEYATQLKNISRQLGEILKKADDPRVTEDPVRFELPPFTDAEKTPPKRK